MPHSENSVGNQLKEKRSGLNLSLKEAETATSIRLVYLQALEDNELQKLPSPVHALGFMKQYASYLGLDGDKLVRENPEIFQKSLNQDFAYGIGTLEMRGNPAGSVKRLPNALWIVAFLGVLFAAWYLAKYLDVL